MNAVRVLIADDHELFRRNLRTLLRGADGIEVVGEAADGVQAVAAASTLDPDVVLMDLHMPRCDGVEAIRRLTESTPHVAVVALTMLDDERSVRAVLHAGARGYLLKGARRAEVVRAVEAAAAGETILGAAVGRRLAGLLDGASAGPPFPELTDREREVLGLVAGGLANGAIAERLTLSPKTVRNNVSTIMSKLSATSRTELVVLAREAGLGGTDAR